MKSSTLKSTNLLILLSLLSGCGTPSVSADTQEDVMVHVSWEVWNNSSMKIGASPVQSTEEPYTNYIPRIFGSFPAKGPLFGGIHASKKHLPEEVDVSWETLLPNSNVKTGDIQGPYRIKIRSRIPSDILTLAAQNKYRLQISISIGTLPVLMDWRLLEYKESMMGFSQSYRETHRGGDSKAWVEQGPDNKEVKVNVYR